MLFRSQLLAETKAYLAEVSHPKASYTASVVDLYAFGRSWEGVGIGDKVAIIDKGFSEAGVRLTGRVSQIERDLLTGDASVTFGNLTDSMADMWQSVSQTLKANSHAAATYDAVAGTSVSWLIQLQDALNDQFNAAGTYKVETFELGTIYSNVPLNPETGLPLRSASSMWAVNISGRGIRLASSLTSSGQWNWKTFITGASVTADCINAGTMRADRIRAGLLTDEHARNKWDLTNGTLSTNSMTAANIQATGKLTTGSTYTMELAGGTLTGKYNGTEVMVIDTNLRFQSGSYGGRITSPYYLVMRVPKLAIDQSTTGNGTVCSTGEGVHISKIERLGDGRIQWWTAEHKFVNGLCIYM